MLFGMNPWVFFALFSLLLASGEFLSRKSVAATVALLSPEERTLSPRRQAAVRVAQISWYGVIVAATVAYWVGVDAAGDVLGVMFILTAVFALLNAISWLSNRQRR
jgi:FtsH-binding integral membrane protein